MANFNELEIFNGERPRAQYYSELAPGLLGECQKAIRDHFEVRSDGSRYRINGALTAALLLAGNKLIQPGGGKVMLMQITLATTGAGKQAAIDFVNKVAEALSLDKCIRIDPVTSTKQLYQAMLLGGGSMVYVSDDNPHHVNAWSDHRNAHMGSFSGELRSMTTASHRWKATIPIVSGLKDEYEKATSDRAIQAMARMEGFQIPTKTIGKGEKARDVPDLDSPMFKMTAVGKQMDEISAAYRLAVDGVERASINTVITMTPESARKFMNDSYENGQIGRAFFVNGHDEVPAFKPTLPDKNLPNELISRLRNMLLRTPTEVVFVCDEVEQLATEMRFKIDEMRTEPGPIGKIATRYGGMLYTIATLVAYGDFESGGKTKATGSRINVQPKHLWWSYFCVIDSLKALDAFYGGDVASDGLAITEWQKMLIAIEKILNRPSFDNDGCMARGKFRDDFFRSKGVTEFAKELASVSDKRNDLKAAKDAIWTEIEESCMGRLFVYGDEGDKRIYAAGGEADTDYVKMTEAMGRYIERALKVRSMSRFRK